MKTERTLLKINKTKIIKFYKDKSLVKFTKKERKLEQTESDTKDHHDNYEHLLLLFLFLFFSFNTFKNLKHCNLQSYLYLSFLHTMF